MRKHTFLTKRQKKRASLRRLYGNPWDSTSSSSRTRKTSSAKSKTSKKRVTFRQPLERSASKSKSSSNVWRTVSSKSISK